MNELQQALSEIHLIRHQVARGTQFRGYGPASIAFSGVLAIAVAWGEMAWAPNAGRDPTVSLAVWIAVALVSVTVTGLETFLRARREHSGFAVEMLHSAIEQFVPSLAVGVLLTVVLVGVAPESSWLLPGVWSLLFSLGVFASCRFLPRQMFAVGAWYLVAGLVSVVAASGPKTFLPWTMGVTFGVGQLLVAAVLQLGFKDTLE